MKVAVVGAGTMGGGIAYVATLAGCSVALTDIRPEAIPPAIRRIGDLFTGGVKRGKLEEADVAAAATRLRADRDLASAVARKRTAATTVAATMFLAPASLAIATP